MDLRLTFLAPLLALGACDGSPSAPPEPAVASVSRIVMHRSGCFGTCPIYTVTITSDGNVTFEGTEHVAAKGTAKWAISAHDVEFLERSIERVGFFGLKESYSFGKDGCKHWGTDAPSVSITVSRGEITKRVTYYYGCRGLVEGDRIKWLSMTIDDVAGTQRSVIAEDEQ